MYKYKIELHYDDLSIFKNKLYTRIQNNHKKCDYPIIKKTITFLKQINTCFDKITNIKKT